MIDTTHSRRSLEEIAADFNLSVSELIDHLEEGKLAIIDPEALEDHLDLTEARNAIAETIANEERPVPWEEVEKELTIRSINVSD
ncbi:MAG: hypothetical protein GVY04_09675 [Cyanobacteria bacterium]|jgi:hypothetical protein|nr:hypothetical protein [Cyanobacteria bacterium GSL.Bin1]